MTATYSTQGAGEAQKGSGNVGSLTQISDYNSGGDACFDQGFIDVTGETPPKPNDEGVTRPTRAHRAHPNLDKALMKKARELVDSIIPTDSYDTQLHLASLSGTLAEMWESAVESSEWHQDILATLESAVKAAAADGGINNAQVGFFREALSDLQQDRLVQENARVIRAEFVRQGFPPLGFVD